MALCEVSAMPIARCIVVLNKSYCLALSRLTIVPVP